MQWAKETRLKASVEIQQTGRTVKALINMLVWQRNNQDAPPVSRNLEADRNRIGKGGMLRAGMGYRGSYRS